MAERIPIDHGSLASGRSKVFEWSVPDSVKTEVLRFLDDLAMGKVHRGKKLTAQRQLKYLHALRPPLAFFNKPTDQIELVDIEAFEREIESGSLKSTLTRKPFAHSTRVDMRMLLRIFLRWRLGEERSRTLTGWLDTRVRHKTPDYLSEDQVERLYRHCRNNRQRFLIAVLFDSGARAEEFHNIRYEDIHLPEEKDNFLRIHLKEEYSKTAGRNIALYWKHSLEAVREYLAERIAEGVKPADPVFQGNYSAIRKQLQRLGRKVLQRPVYYHLLRHSSATYYASKLNRQELCIRYGWRFSSNMPDVYISRAGMTTRQLDEKFAQTELSTLKEDLIHMNEDNLIKTQRIEQLQQSLESLKRNMEQISAVLAFHPSVQQLEQVLTRKRQVGRKD